MAFFTKVKKASKQRNEPGLRNASAYSAQCLWGDTDVGGNVFERNVADEVGLIGEQAEVALFGGFAEKGQLSFGLFEEELLGRLTPDSLADDRLRVDIY